MGAVMSVEALLETRVIETFHMDGGEGDGGLCASQEEETPIFLEWFSTASNGYPYQDRDKSIEMRTFLSGKLFFDLLLETVDLDGASLHLFCLGF